jgi:hypothetical protein
MSFEDVDAAAFAADEPTAPSPKEEDDDLSDDDLDDDSADESEDEPEGEDEDSDEEEDDEEDEDEEEEEPAEEEGSEDGKDAAGVHEVKVNGKVRKFSLEQLKQIASSGWHNKEQYDAFQTEKRGFEEVKASQMAELTALNARVTPIYEALKAKDSKTAIIEIAKTLGGNRLEVERRLRQQLFPQFVDFLGLDPEAVKALVAKRQPYIKNRFLREEQERERTQAEKNRKPKELEEAERTILGLQAKHGISRQEMQDSFEYAAKALYNGDGDKVTVEDLERVTLTRRTVTRACDAIALRRPRLLKDQKFVDATVKKLHENPTWSTESLGRWIEKRYRKLSGKRDETALARDVSRKVLKTGQESRYKSPSEQKKKPMKFSDLDDEGGGLI